MNINIIEVDTKKLEDILEELNGLINDYAENIDSLYEELVNIKDVWTGVDSEHFISKRLDEKSKYLELNAVLNEYKSCLISVIKKMDESNYV